MSEWEPLSEADELQRLEEEHHGQHRRSFTSSSSVSSASGPSQTTSHCPDRPITRDIILHAISKQGTKIPSSDRAAEDKVLAKQTHLHLNNQRLTKIQQLKGLNGLETLYLYDNRIGVIEGVSHLANLTHLYLQNNQIREISGLVGLRNLQKLYLQGNYIQYVSGLQGLPSLEELHINDQHMDPGFSLEFDPDALRAVASTLRVLCAISCQIEDFALQPVEQLYGLRRLDLGRNSIQGMEALEVMLRCMPRIMSLDLRGNPVCKALKYRSSMLLLSDCLAVLDDEPVSAQQREALLRFNIHKMKMQLKAEQQQQQQQQQQHSSGQGSGAAASVAAASHQNSSSSSSSSVHTIHLAAPKGAPAQGSAAGSHHLHPSAQQQQRHAPAVSRPAGGFAPAASKLVGSSHSKAASKRSSHTGDLTLEMEGFQIK